MESPNSDSNLQNEVLIYTQLLKTTMDELEATKNSLKEEQNKRKQSSAEFRKRIKELTEKNEELTKQLEAVRNLQSSSEAKSSRPYSFVVDEVLNNELHGLRIQHNQDVSQIETLKRGLEEAREKQEKDSKSPNKKNNPQAGQIEASKLLQKLVKVKQDSNNIINDLNSSTYKEMRAAFDAQLSTIKVENNNLIKAIAKVKLTTRSFAALEKELMALRAENNTKIKQVRRDAAVTALKITTLYKEFSKDYSQKYMAMVDQYDKELKQFRGLDLWTSEKKLQEEIIKKLQNEKEFLVTIISKQDDI